MRVPVSWLREYVDLPADLSTVDLAARLTAFDLKLEEIVSSGISGPLVVGRVLDLVKEEQKNGKTINWCRVDVGAEHNDASVPDAPGEDVPSRGIICGAHNFVEGDLVVVSLPGTVLPSLAQYIPGGLISARKTYGHVSDGMICSTSEVGLPGDASGIIVLDADSAKPGDDAIALLGLGEEVLDLEVNPDRAYALSLRGVARDAAIAFGVPFHDPADVAVETSGESYPVRVEDADACPVFTMREVTGFDPTRPDAGLDGAAGSSSPACARSRWPSTSATTSCSSWGSRTTPTTGPSCAATSSCGARTRARASRPSTTSCARSTRRTC